MSKIKIQDHSLYKGQTDKQIIDRIKKTQKLLKQFNVTAYAFDPGVLCYYKTKGLIVREVYMSFNCVEWEWLEPLLKELTQWRNDGEKFNMFMSAKERRKYETRSKKS